MVSSSAVDYQRMEEGLQALLGHHAAVSCCSTDGDISTLAPVERSAISGAITRRQKEFAAGRAAAREAMRRLGRSAASIPMQDDRSPQWPADIVGSISHSHTACVSVVAFKSRWKGVGVDVEPDQDLPRELWSLIGLPSELRRASALPDAMQARWMMRIFSAKEAYFKWVYPQIQVMLDFHDVAIELEPSLGAARFVARSLRQDAQDSTPIRLEGMITTTQDMVVSLVTH